MSESKPAKKYSKWHGILLAILTVGGTLTAIFHGQGPAIVHPGPVLQAIDNTNYRSVEDFVAIGTVDGTTYRVTVYSNAVTDGASIGGPAIQALLGLNPLSGVLVRGAFLHDRMYRAHALPQSVCDKLLRLWIGEDGCEPHKADEIYRKVRQFGGAAYEGYSDADIMAAQTFIKVEVVPPANAAPRPALPDGAGRRAGTSP